MNPTFWRGKKVFLSGHTGFQGSWLSLWLQKLGATVVGYALDPPTEPNLFNLASVGGGMESIRGDVRDFEALQKTVDRHRPEIVLHLAAQALVASAYDSPLETFSTNVLGTVHLLEAVRQAPEARALIVITSDKCYENREWEWGYREVDRLGGKDPYSASKASAELVVSAYRHSFFKPIATARAGNVIGGGDWAANRIIPDIVRALRENKPVVLRNPSAIRPWQHVLEPLNGYLELAERLWESSEKYQGAWNFGPDPREAKPVSWIAEQMLRLWGKKPEWVLREGETAREDIVLKLDSSKAKSQLGWSTKLSLAEALKWSVDWYRVFLEDGAVRAFTEEQISRFQEKAPS